MYIAYYDEAGDDGIPGSSPVFVLTSLYVHHTNWKDIYNKIYQFRKQLKTDFNIPVKQEFHTKYFALNKKPYRAMNLTDSDRVLVMDLFCKFLASLEIKVVNTIIDKANVGQNKDYDVLEKALTYSIQRIENDLNKQSPIEKFLTITDEGRVGKMQQVTRKIQQFNYIPSKYGFNSYRNEIKLLIEDPLPKNSKESYWIQICDLISFIVYNFYLDNNLKVKLHNRMPNIINSSKLVQWMNELKPILNLKASNKNQFGLVVYPN